MAKKRSYKANESSWQDLAACTGIGPEQFFALGKSERPVFMREQAKAVCRQCPVEGQCLEYSLENREVYGIWGGKDEDERRAILKQRREPSKALGKTATDQ